MTVKPIQFLERPPLVDTPEPGIYYDIPDATYNSWAGSVRSSLLNVARTRTMAHAHWAMQHPSEDTDALRLGRIVHAAVLEEERFAREFARGPDVKLNTNVGKDLWKKAQRDNPGRTLLRYHEYNTAEAIVESVWRRPEHAHVRDVLRMCEQREVSLVWIDPDTGVKCRARLDALGLRVGLEADVKTTMSAAERAFRKQIEEHGYDLQRALYRRGARELGLTIHDSVFLVLEKEPPFLADVFEVPDFMVREGERELDRMLRAWAECERTGVWPGYGSHHKVADYPDWKKRQLDRGGF